jgi:flagellum-specific peptidoglycan hydrolase FlgJ
MSKVKEDTAKVDNTAVVKPKVFERLRVTPRKYELVDLGGTPSNDTRTPAERNKDYLHPIKGAKERFKASMSNETNPLVGIERTILPSAAGAALVTTPIALAKGAGYGFGIDKLTGGWGNMVERTTGIPSEIAQYTNPGAIIGGAAGYRLDQKNLLSKFIKGDADLAWNPINKNHCIFNKEARTASNIGMAVTNRLAPFLQGVEKLPLKVAAYKTAKRTKGNASVTLSEIKGNPSDYAGASILGGGNLEGRNLVAQYIFGENPIIKRVFFNKATSNIKPISNNEAKRGFSHGDRYEQLYPGIYNRRYEMRSVVPQGRPLKFSSSEFAEYAGNNPVGKVIGKEGDMIMRTGDTEFMVFRNPGTNYVGPIDDVGGHVIKLQMDKGKLKQTSQDMWKFNPADYAKRWNESPNAPDQVRLTKQAALMDKVGTPFILQQSNPIWIEGRSVRQAMKVGGKFTFKKSPAVKDAEKLNGKRDMRKKFIKSSRPTYKRRIRKGQVGMRFVSYVPVNNPTIDYTDITNPINPFSEYYIPTTYNTEQALVVPEREDSKSDTVEETPAVASKPIAELVVNKPVASKVVVDNTANSTWSSPYKDRSKWMADLTNAYKRAGITNDNAIRMLVSQDALESAWGRSAQGKFNFGNLTTGAKWKGDYVTGNDKNAKGEAIKQKFRSYNSMDEYAADKVQFLKRLYDFEENDDINKFVAKLTGSNKGKRRYAEARNYADTLKKVYNSYRSGGIIKYQNSAQPIKYMGGYDKRGNMVLPVTNENGMNNVTLPEVTVTPRNINLAGAVDRGRREAAPYISTLLAGTMFGPLPVLSEAIGSTTVDEATRELSKGKYNTWGDMMTNAGMNPVLAEFTNPGSYIGLHGFNKFGPRLKPVEDLAASGNKWARARVISKAINKGTPSVEPLPNNVGWGPRQSIHVVHDKNSARFPKLYYPERWDAVYEGAPEAGIWYQGKFGNPRTAANHSIPGKAEKAAKARERFAKRPYRVEGDLELERPIVTVGDVPNRAALERAADKMNADGVIFNNVYDNGYSNNQVIFSFRDNLKNGRLFKKEANTLASNKYPPYDMAVNYNPDRSLNVDKVHRDVARGTKEAIDFLESDIKKETDLYNKKLAQRLGYKHFTPYSKGAERARVEVVPDYDKISYPNSGDAGKVTLNSNPAEDILSYNVFYNLHPTSFHETLHRGLYGMISRDKMPIGGNLFEHIGRKTDTRDFYSFKTKKLLVPENEAPDLTTYNYLFEEGEAAANTMELGKRLGLKPGQEYPGRKALEQMLKEFSESGNEHSHMPSYLNMRHPKRVWDALTGRYFIYPTAVGTTLIGGANNDNDK